MYERRYKDLRRRFHRQVRAYIRENTHPDCLPEMRYAYVLPGPVTCHAATLDEAFQAVAAISRPSKEGTNPCNP